MKYLILILLGVFTLSVGSLLGYFARQSIARKQADTIETKLRRKIVQVKKEAEEITTKAEEKASEILSKTKRDVETQRQRLFDAENILLKREKILGERLTGLEEKEKDFHQKASKLKEIKVSLETLREESLNRLEKVAKLSKEDAKKELLEGIEQIICLLPNGEIGVLNESRIS